MAKGEERNKYMGYAAATLVMLASNKTKDVDCDSAIVRCYESNKAGNDLRYTFLLRAPISMSVSHAPALTKTNYSCSLWMRCAQSQHGVKKKKQQKHDKDTTTPMATVKA